MTGESRVPKMKGGDQSETTGDPDREATIYPEHEETWCDLEYNSRDHCGPC